MFWSKFWKKKEEINPFDLAVEKSIKIWVVLPHYELDPPSIEEAQLMENWMGGSDMVYYPPSNPDYTWSNGLITNRKPENIFRVKEDADSQFDRCMIEYGEFLVSRGFEILCKYKTV